MLDPARTEIRYNREWSDPLGARGMIELAARYTVARMMERDDFAKRFKAGAPIRVHEFLYPLMQGYDSVALKADLELGGTDQKFNLLVGPRSCRREYGQEPQCILTMPLLEGLDGVEKMSKSKGNYIGITEPPNDHVRQAAVDLATTLMWRYFALLSLPLRGRDRRAQGARSTAGRNPKDAKVMLATRDHRRASTARRRPTRPSADFANRAARRHSRRHRRADAGGRAAGYRRPAQAGRAGAVDQRGNPPDRQGGVRIDGAVVSDKGLKLARRHLRGAGRQAQVRRA